MFLCLCVVKVKAMPRFRFKYFWREKKTNKFSSYHREREGVVETISVCVRVCDTTNLKCRSAGKNTTGCTFIHRHPEVSQTNLFYFLVLFTYLSIESFPPHPPNDDNNRIAMKYIIYDYFDRHRARTLFTIPFNWKRLIEKLHSVQGFAIKTKSSETNWAINAKEKIEIRCKLQLGEISVFVLCCLI